jgi:hypothetical protein
MPPPPFPIESQTTNFQLSKSTFSTCFWMLEFEKFISSFRGYMSHAIGAICDGCYEREEIVEGEEAAQPIASFVFPRVTVLHLGLLPRVKWFY